MNQTKQIVVQCTISSTLEKVWDCFTNAEHIVEWNFASPDWHCPAAMNEVKVGGTFSYRMGAKDGSFQFDFEGKFTSVEPEKRLDYILIDGRKVSVRFELKDGKVLLTEYFEAENENPIELQQNGWQAILNNFKSYVEGL